jgi:hypothetical protein
MLISKMSCDGCLRRPRFWEWLRGEMSAGGYEDWRHPAIPFKNGGCPLTPDNRAKADRIFLQMFGENGPPSPPPTPATQSPPLRPGTIRRSFLGGRGSGVRPSGVRRSGVRRSEVQAFGLASESEIRHSHFTIGV